MASVGHVVVGMAAARWHHGTVTRGQFFAAMLGWSILSLLPDADVIGLSLGIDYHDVWGHRGASHSIAVALLAGVPGAWFARLCGGRALQTGLLVAAVVVSHGLLDSLTDGGLGAALLWPFRDDRYFAPWNPIPVAPIGLRFLSPAGMGVALTEMLLFAALLAYAIWPRGEEGRRQKTEGKLAGYGDRSEVPGREDR